MPRSITIEDLYRLKFVSRPRISPDGKRVAFVVTRIDGGKHEYRSAVWMVPTDGGEAKKFTTETASTGSPNWSPDGRWLAFVSEREGELSGKDKQEQKKRGKDKPQIWLIPSDGGEARQLTSMEHGASTPVWSPDGKYILFSAAVGPSDEENEEGKPLPKVRVIDRLSYRFDGVGFTYERRSHLFLLDIAGGTIEQLTDGDWDDGDAAWSPDGTRIVFASDRTDDRWTWLGPDLYTLTIQDGKAGALRRLTDETLSCGSPSWSPDGKTLAFLASDKYYSAGHVSLYTIAPDAQGSPATCLSSEFEGSCMDWTNSDIGDDHLQPPPAWSTDGESLYVLASRRGASQLFALSTRGNNAQPSLLTPGNVHIRDFTIDTSKNRMALLVANATRPQEIFIISPGSSEKLRQVTGLNEELFSDLQVATPEYMQFTGADGWQIDGWVLKPSAFDSSKKYPLVVQIHGGPHTQYGYGFFHEMQMQAGAGYVVFYTNPRGSCGYGFDFADAVREAWGVKDSLDILMGVDALVQRGYIDEQRMAVMGGSYGGFMTNWLVGHTDRFKVAITDRCVADLVSMFGSSDIGWLLSEKEVGGVPWENLEHYRQRSPISYVQNIRTPLLIIHSEQDLRCNIEQAEQLFTALKWMGREVKFVRFEGQSHGLSRGGHPHSRLERLRHIKSWLEQHLM